MKKFSKRWMCNQFDEKPRIYKSNWPRRVTRKNSNRVAKIMLNYVPGVGGRLGRPFKRLLDEVETGLSRPNWWRMMMMMMMMFSYVHLPKQSQSITQGFCLIILICRSKLVAMLKFEPWRMWWCLSLRYFRRFEVSCRLNLQPHTVLMSSYSAYQLV